MLVVVIESRRLDVGHWAHVRVVAHVYTTHAAVPEPRPPLRWSSEDDLVFSRDNSRSAKIFFGGQR
jgi:hypothetical protein